MKRLWLSLVFLIAVSPAFGADQWDKTDPAGTENLSDIDTLIQANNEATDRLVYNYRRNLSVVPATINTVSVLEGEIAIPNAAGSIVRWRRNTSTTTITWADLDTGAEAVSTQYYIYCLADTDATTCTFKVSTNATSPTGATYYRKIGYFYNSSAGSITSVGNIKGGDAPNIVSVAGTSDITTTSATAAAMTDMKIYFVASGRPVRVTFAAPFGTDGDNYYGWARIYVDGVDVSGKIGIHAHGTANETSVPGQYLGVLSSGTHTVEVYWEAGLAGWTISQTGTTGQRILIAEEL